MLLCFELFIKNNKIIFSMTNIDLFCIKK